jgi:hypothetical protein
MKYLVYIILLLIILSFYFSVNEGFTVYEINYGSEINPWWEQLPGLHRIFYRCICSTIDDCQCISYNQL